MADTFAAIMPVYKRPTASLEALDSIVAQQRLPDRLIIADDGSGDGTAENIQRWIAEKQPACEVKLLQLEHSGAPSTINAAVKEAGDCDVMGILDSDDLWPNDYISTMAGAMANDSAAVAATCDKISITYPGETTEYIDYRAIPRDATEWIFLNGSTGPSNTVFRLEAFRTIGGFNSEVRTGYDLHMMLRLSRRGAWLHVPGPVVTYRDGYGEFKGEAGPLSHSFPDRRLRRAKSMEHVLFEEGVAEALAESVWKSKLGRMWFKAGKQLAKNGHNDQAKECFARAVHYSPWHLRAQWRRIVG